MIRYNYCKCWRSAQASEDDYLQYSKDCNPEFLAVVKSATVRYHLCFCSGFPTVHCFLSVLLYVSRDSIEKTGVNYTFHSPHITASLGRKHDSQETVLHDGTLSEVAVEGLWGVLGERKLSNSASRKRTTRCLGCFMFLVNREIWLCVWSLVFELP